MRGATSVQQLLFELRPAFDSRTWNDGAVGLHQTSMNWTSSGLVWERVAKMPSLRSSFVSVATEPSTTGLSARSREDRGIRILTPNRRRGRLWQPRHECRAARRQRSGRSDADAPGAPLPWRFPAIVNVRVRGRQGAAPNLGLLRKQDRLNARNNFGRRKFAEVSAVEAAGRIRRDEPDLTVGDHVSPQSQRWKNAPA